MFDALALALRQFDIALESTNDVTLPHYLMRQVQLRIRRHIPSRLYRAKQCPRVRERTKCIVSKSTAWVWSCERTRSFV